jgi:hypothetical protein
MANEFNIKTEIFEGPLDLLLSLIEKRNITVPMVKKVMENSITSPLPGLP